MRGGLGGAPKECPRAPEGRRVWKLPRMTVGWRSRPGPLTVEEGERVSVFSSIRWGQEFLSYLAPRIPQRTWGHGAWEKPRGIIDVSEVTIPPSPGPPAPMLAPPGGGPSVLPTRQGPGSFSATRLNVNTQGKLQGKHTADKNLMLYVTKQNEYLIRAFMRNHITNRPHAAGRTARTSPLAAPRARQRSS